MAQLKRVARYAAPLAVAGLLFWYGISAPMALRVRGDAASYLRIATDFHRVGDVLAYAGERTVGMPLFDALFHWSNDITVWVNLICAALLLVHLAAAWLFARWAAPGRAPYLFALLASHPALVGHTITPLSDTIAVDVFLLCIVLFARALREQRTALQLVMAAGVGAGAAYAILLRPAFEAGVLAALVIGIAIGLRFQRRAALLLGTASVAGVALLMPFALNCQQRYGQLCLQAPATFDPVLHAQMGLRGARLLWNQRAAVPAEYPVLTDELMFAHFYKRCRLQSIVGLSEESLTGCLLQRPHLTPVLIVKKWIGLFDHFRFQPYMENATPAWLVFLSRLYDSLLWIGFALALLALARLRQLSSVVGHLPLALLATFSLVMLAEHTALHVEDRFSFPVLPLCALALVQVRITWRSAIYAAVCWLAFIGQVLAWDRTPFH